MTHRVLILSMIAVTALGGALLVTQYNLTNVRKAYDALRLTPVTLGSPEYPKCQWTGTIEDIVRFTDPENVLGDAIIRWTYTCERVIREGDNVRPRAPTCTANPRKCA